MEDFEEVSIKTLTPSLEDYLKTIAILLEEKDVVRVKDIADRMGVKMPSVSAALRSLAERGFVEYERYGFVKLSLKGKRAAGDLKRRYRAFKKFFIDILGVPEGIAEKDACRVEHFLSESTRKRMCDFIEFVNNNPECATMIKRFRTMEENT